MKGFFKIYLLGVCIINCATGSCPLEQDYLRRESHLNSTTISTIEEIDEERVKEFNQIPAEEDDLGFLVEKENHYSFLFSALEQAQISIFLVSRNIHTIDNNILNILKQKALSNVKVWIFSPTIHPSAKIKLEDRGVPYETLPLQLNLVGIDTTLLILGSFNWFDNHVNPSTHSSLIIQSSQIGGAILGQVWEDKDRYRPPSALTEKEINKYTKRLDAYLRSKTLQPELVSLQPFHIELLTTQDQYFQFLKKSFWLAKSQITIHTCLNVQEKELLKSFIKGVEDSPFFKEGGKVEIFYSLLDKEATFIEEAKVDHSSIKWVLQKKDCSHSIIIDKGKLATIGSSNWLALDKRTFSLTLLFKGQTAQWLADILSTTKGI